jgi:ComF family protein
MHASCHPRVAYVFGGAVSYDLPLAQTLIRALKFQGIRSAAVPLGALIVEYIEALGLLRQGHRVPVIVPVPLSIERQRMRGFDQAALIAQEVADRMRLPLRTGLLQRVRHTPPQTSMHGRDAREHNLAGCFAVGTDSPAPGAPIFLVDDVVTTGTTMAEAARTIRSRHDGPLICLAAAQA